MNRPVLRVVPQICVNPRNGKPIDSVESWFEHAPPTRRRRRWRDTRSAKELAKAFCGSGAVLVPQELASLLDSNPSLGPVEIIEAWPEHKMALDSFRGECGTRTCPPRGGKRRPRGGDRGGEGGRVLRRSHRNRRREGEADVQRPGENPRPWRGPSSACRPLRCRGSAASCCTASPLRSCWCASPEGSAKKPALTWLLAVQSTNRRAALTAMLGPSQRESRPESARFAHRASGSAVRRGSFSARPRDRKRFGSLGHQPQSRTRRPQTTSRTAPGRAVRAGCRNANPR
jgi:hypothetical protein